MKLRIKATSSSDVSVLLYIKLTATYPKTVPILRVEESAGLRSATESKVNQLLHAKPKELVGEVMIHEIATSVEDILEDAFQRQQRDSDVPSLEEERALQEAAATEAAKQLEASRRKEAELEKAEEDRAFKQMLDQEISRQEARRKSRGPLVSPAAIEDGTFKGSSFS